MDIMATMISIVHGIVRTMVDRGIHHITVLIIVVLTGMDITVVFTMAIILTITIMLTAHPPGVMQVMVTGPPELHIHLR